MAVHKINIQLKEDRIIVSHFKKGTVLDIPNIGIFEEKNERYLPLSFGKRPEDVLQTLSGKERDAFEGQVIHKLFTTSLISEEGIKNGTGWIALEYFIGMAASSDLLLLPILSFIDLRLDIEHYETFPGTVQNEFECSLASHPYLRSTTINGKPLSQLKWNLRLARWIRHIAQLVFLSPVVVLFLWFFDCPLPVVETGVEPSLFTALMIGFMSATIFLLLYYFVILGSTLLWVWLTRYIVPQSVLQTELDYIQSPPDWFKVFLSKAMLKNEVSK